ncbi:hypothetical protein HOLleu_26702 [Holothuria leucospilota]|uniref:Uncharacterized protein n=1 Tax=Holothuria leucospilota TaxID=206669 RepID=A0A9Q1BPK1_HOLLE|nr:hypothetical protein HOLleu_26702 [Holothuria leucospilota]
MKILKDPETGKARILMRREQVLKDEDEETKDEVGGYEGDKQQLQVGVAEEEGKEDSGIPKQQSVFTYIHISVLVYILVLYLSLTVCANHYITQHVNLLLMKALMRSWVWRRAMDSSDGDPTE